MGHLKMGKGDLNIRKFDFVFPVELNLQKWWLGMDWVLARNFVVCIYPNL